eukprot:GHRR01036646.1.p1 GENE.GHRR01036646.1~~GHRR01036646.1.p1  ORF type:complete len:203 (+),score=93.69 GHRR01036646.1:559-1167(+)
MDACNANDIPGSTHNSVGFVYASNSLTTAATLILNAAPSYTPAWIMVVSYLQARPMSSNRGAGFSSNPRGRFDPFGQAGKSPLGAGSSSSSLLPKKQEPSAEEIARGLEKKVHELLESSVLLAQQGNAQGALEKASEARKKERSLAKFRDGAGQADNHPPELAFAVELQLASCYAASKLWSEALELYGAMVKNKHLPSQAGR